MPLVLAALGDLPIVDVLRLGLSGLVFLLSYLAYKLLAQEQAKPSPNTRRMKGVVLFMALSVLSALIVGGFSLAELLLRRDEPRRMLRDCRVSLARVETYLKMPNVSPQDFRSIVQGHVGQCGSALEQANVE
ncbi:hypothetical protein F0U61_42035 [Archangium violaceum]|uniref:hypothetical protein n=1 Tax=Archangium violaceum TaxID=83451 RepID=UPI002B27D959|nr:hypothetical protein F0U61_42035 [Archangium violaceum]